jgi:hypothetical protein
MTKLLVAALPVLCLALVSSPASAREYHFSGSGCTPTKESINCAEPGQWGMGNTCTTPMTIFCALPLWKQGTSTPTTVNVVMSAFDRSSSDNVFCDIHRTDTSGNDLTTLHVTTTNSQTGIYDVTAPLSGVPATDTWWASCSVPGSNVNGFSHLVTLKFTTSD